MVTINNRPEQGMAEKIYHVVEKAKEKKGIKLTRLGASSIGEECLRRVFYSWRSYSQRQTEGRMHLLFETGDIYEKRIIQKLREIGLEVWDRDGNGKQWTWAHPSGHFTIFADGVCRGVLGAEKTPHLLETKSHNQNNFEKLNKYNVKVSHPEHYIQCQMGMWGLRLERALYVGVNKNDDAYYFERLHLDRDCVAMVEEKIQKLISSTLTPAGISQTANAPGCKYCYHKGVCVGKEAPLKHCRTCRNVRSVANEKSEWGDWFCEVHQKNLSYGEQLRACDSYEATQEGRPLGSYLMSG